jgi:hypothetical protein
MKEKIEKLIFSISSDLQTLKDNYFIIGSCVMILLGLPIEKTSDLDLLVSHNDAERLKLIWGSRLRKNYTPADAHLFRSNFGRFNFDELDIEIMGELKVFNNNGWKVLRINDWIEISVGHQMIKIPTLKEQMRILSLFGREKDKLKVKLIEGYL